MFHAFFYYLLLQSELKHYGYSLERRTFFLKNDIKAEQKWRTLKMFWYFQECDWVLEHVCVLCAQRICVVKLLLNFGSISEITYHNFVCIWIKPTCKLPNQIQSCRIRGRFYRMLEQMTFKMFKDLYKNAWQVLHCGYKRAFCYRHRSLVG